MDLSIESGSSKKKLFLNIFVLLVAVVSFVKRDYQLTKVSAVEMLFIDSLGPTQEIIGSMQTGVGDLFDHYLFNASASRENKQLKDQISKLELKIFDLNEIERENERLRDLLDFGEALPTNRVLAQIVAWDASSSFRVLRINKGIRHGIELQSTVVTSDGLVGYIYRLTNNYADVLTILDANNRIDGLVKRTRSHGILEGYSSSHLIMKYVTRTEPVILGDYIITSGLGNVYPKGIRVGRVSRIERQSYGITQHVEVRPSVDFGSLEEVVVLTTKVEEIHRQEWEVLDDPFASRLLSTEVE